MFEDDDDKEVIFEGLLHVLPVHDLTDDDGDETFASVGVANLATVPSQDLLVATHQRDASVSIFDLSLGPFGEETRQDGMLAHG